MFNLTIPGLDGFLTFLKNILYIIYTFILVSIFFIVQYVFIKLYIFLGKSINKGINKMHDFLDVSNNGFAKLLMGRK